MKRIILSAAVMTVGLATIKASNLTIDKYPAAVNCNLADTAQKTPVKLDALPDPIKTVLQSDIFKTWVPSSAFSVTQGTIQYYEIDVKKGTEIKALKFDKDGKIVQ